MSTRRLLLTGAGGQLGGHLLQQASQMGLHLTAWSGCRTGILHGIDLQAVDLADPEHVADAFRQCRPDVVLHAAAVASVAACQRDPAFAQRINTAGSTLLASLAAEARARLVLVSTDLVFGGDRAPYREQDPPAPQSAYGRSKQAAELAVLAVPGNLVARVSLLFGPSVHGRTSFFDEQVVALRQQRPLRLFVDEWRTPLSLRTAAQALLALASSPHEGMLHLAGPERMSRMEMGERLAAYLGVSSSSIVPTRRDEQASPEPRPRDTSLDCARWRELFPGQPWPCLEEALREMDLV